jgi:hypothetical protein
MEYIGYTNNHINVWGYRPDRISKGCISFYKGKKKNFVKFDYTTTIPISEFTTDMLFEYIQRKAPELKDKIRDYKINQILK